MKTVLLSLTLAGALMFAASPASAHDGHSRYDRDHDRVVRHVDRDHRRSQRRVIRYPRKHAKQYRRVNEREYRRHYRGHQSAYAPRYFRQHAVRDRCGLRHRHFHGGRAYFGSLEAYVLGEAAREVVYQIIDR